MWISAAFLAGLLGAQSPPEGPSVLRAEDEPRQMLYRYLERECRRYFDLRRQAVGSLKTPEDVARRQAELRESFLAALGGLPERTPLEARVCGSEPRDGFRVEKIVFESRPRHHVTALLYLPDARTPVPGVLFPCGHWPAAKSAEDYQRACMLLAKNGMAALCFDPIGQGERIQLLTPEGKPTVGGGTFEHTYATVGALLVGSCSAQFEIWDGMRALDYLASRPEVDPARLGCMGNSGGGTQTAYLMALDPRIACAVPNCFITSLERLFATRGPEDGEQNIPGHVASGMEHADYLLLRAPRPTQISCTTRDFFDIQGAWTTFREAKRVYALLGHAERVDLFEANEPHSLSRPLREAAVGWFRRWLTRVDEIPAEPDLPVASDEALRCTRTGQVVTEFQERTVFDLTAERERSLAPLRGRGSRDELLAEVRRKIGCRDMAPARVAGDDRILRDRGRELLARVYETEAGIRVPALGLAAAVADGDALVLRVHGEGKAKDPGWAALLAGSGNPPAPVLALDLRGMGETLPERRRVGWEGAFGYDWQESFLGFHLNRPLLGQRVDDLRAIVQACPAGKRISLVGLDGAAPVALHEAALDPRISELTLEGGLLSWSLVAETPLAVRQLTNVVPGALKSYDLPDLAALVAPRPLTLRNPVDASGRRVSRAQAEEACAPARAAYRVAGASEKFVLVVDP